MGVLLQTELLLPSVRKYGSTVPNTLKRWFPDTKLPMTGSDKFTWDIEKASNEAIDAYGVAGGKPIPVSRDEVQSGHARLPGLSFERALTERELLYERMPGLPDAGAIESRVLRDIGQLVARIERRKEVERSLALTGTLTYKINSVTYSVDMEIPTAMKPHCTASWATAGTDILKDVNVFCDTFAKNAGVPARHMLINRTTFGYFLANTGLKAWAAAMQTRFSDDLVTKGVPFPMLGVDVLLVDSYYVAGGTSYPFIADGYVSILPDPAVLAPGEEMLGPALMGTSVEWGLVAQRKELADDDIKAIVKKNSINLLTRPDAVMYADIINTS